MDGFPSDDTFEVVQKWEKQVGYGFLPPNQYRCRTINRRFGTQDAGGTALHLPLFLISTPIQMDHHRQSLVPTTN